LPTREEDVPDTYSACTCLPEYVLSPKEEVVSVIWITTGQIIAYWANPIGPTFPRLSFAKNLSVELVLMVIPETGLGLFVLDVVGVDPSVV